MMTITLTHYQFPIPHSHQTPSQIPPCKTLIPRYSRFSATSFIFHRLSTSCQRVAAGINASNSDFHSDSPYQIPDSMEQAISQAATAVEHSINTKREKISIEIPVLDNSDQAALDLAHQLVSSLPSSQKTLCSIGTVASLTLEMKKSDTKTKNMCIVAPRIQDLPDLESLLSTWYGSTAILLNAEWAPYTSEDDSMTPPQHGAFVRSFETVYCFYPIAAKAFGVVTIEGAVFRMLTNNTTGGGGGGKKAGTRKKQSSASRNAGFSSSTTKKSTVISTPAPNTTNSTNTTQMDWNMWRIFINRGGSEGWEAIGRMPRRPSSIEVEVAFYNATASNSPLTKGAKFLKNLIGGK